MERTVRKPRQVHRRLHDRGTETATAAEAPTDVVMKWMLDTNICIDIIKERPRSVLDRFKGHAIGEIGISVVTLAELEYGVSASSRPAKNRDALDQFVTPLEVAPFDRAATTAYGR